MQNSLNKTDSTQEIILQLYDAASDNSLWPEVLQKLAEEVNAVGCIIFEWNSSQKGRHLTAPIISSYYDPESVKTYIEKCFTAEASDQDVFEAHSLRQDGIDLIEDNVLAGDIEKLKQLPNVQVLQKLGILHRAAGLLNKDNTATSRFSIQLSRSRGPLNLIEKSKLSLILPHVSKALDMARPSQQLSELNKTLLSAMNNLTIGICILDCKGRIVQINEEFRRQQEEHHAFTVLQNGELHILHSNSHLKFTDLKGSVFNHGKFGARPRKEAIATGDGGFLCIELIPLQKSNEISSFNFNGYIVYSTDTNRPLTCNTSLLQRAYGLTNAEINIVELISLGLTNRQISEQVEKSTETVNSQVKSILSKTQTQTRTQFVRMLMSFEAKLVK